MLNFLVNFRFGEIFFWGVILTGIFVTLYRLSYILHASYHKAKKQMEEDSPGSKEE